MVKGTIRTLGLLAVSVLWDARAAGAQSNDSSARASAIQPGATLPDPVRAIADSSGRTSSRTDPVVSDIGGADSVAASTSGPASPRILSGHSVGATVTVKGEARHKRKEISTSVLKRQDIEKVAATAQDPMRALPTLPGVSAASDLSVRPVVRGGDITETSVQLDGVPLLMPYHFGSVFSVFHREAIEDFQLYTGVAPAQSEGALSGTVVARTRPAPVDTLFGGFDVSMLRGSAWVGVPLVKDKVGLWLSAQSLWYDWTIKRLMDLGGLLGAMSQKDVDEYESEITLPTTWDLQGGLSVKVGRDWLWETSGFLSGDRYRVMNTLGICTDNGVEVPCPNTGNQCLNGVCTEVCYNDKYQVVACSATLLHKTILDTQAYVGISNWMGESRLSWNPDRDLSVEAVAALQSVNWDVQFPGNRDLVADSVHGGYKVVRTSSGELFDWTRGLTHLDVSARKRWNESHETSVGAGWERGTESVNTDLTRPLAQLILGTTGNPLEFFGIYNQTDVLILKSSPDSRGLDRDMLEDFSFKYDSRSTTNRGYGWGEHRWDPDAKTRVRAGVRVAQGVDGSLEIPDPRLQIQHQLTEDDMIGAGAALHTQSELPFEWKLSATTPLESEKAWLGVLEWEHALAPGWRGTLTGWGKLYQDLASPSVVLTGALDTNSSIGNAKQTRTLRYASTGKGWATGVEASLRYQPTEGWTGWGSAEWSVSRRKDRGDGIWYPFGLERPWKLSWVNAFRIDGKWEVSARYIAMGGMPYTPFVIESDPFGSYATGDTALWIGRRNSGTLAAYQRLDLRVSRESTLFGKSATFYYEIWNAFNDPNMVLRDASTGNLRGIQLNTPIPTIFLGTEVRF